MRGPIDRHRGRAREPIDIAERVLPADDAGRVKFKGSPSKPPKAVNPRRSDVKIRFPRTTIAEFRIRAGGFGARAVARQTTRPTADGRCQSGLSQGPISLSNQQIGDCAAAWNRPDIGSAAAGRKEILIETGLRRLTERTRRCNSSMGLLEHCRSTPKTPDRFAKRFFLRNDWLMPKVRHIRPTRWFPKYQVA